MSFATTTDRRSHEIDSATLQTKTIVSPENGEPLIVVALSNAPNPHQIQYNSFTAQYFNTFNKRTGRDIMFSSYIDGYLSNNSRLKHENSIGVDLGCGTGWLTTHLSEDFNEVYGIDTSRAMLDIAVRNSKSADTANGAVGKIANIAFHQKVPEHIIGKCDFVVAVHVHYHFDTLEKLKNEFLKTAQKLLRPDGEFLLIGCPSDHIYNTPEHYTNFVHTSDIPEEIIKQMSQLDLITDKDGFVSLSDLPRTCKDGTPFTLKDGTQMKVVFKTTDGMGRTETLSLRDTFWSDLALINAARECGLAPTPAHRKNLRYYDHPNAYMALHFAPIALNP